MKHFVYSLITLLQVGFLCNAAQVGFNKIGYVTNIPNNSFFYYSVALQPDGKIVAVGMTDGNDPNGLIARFNTDGELDQNFNNGTGFINTEVGTNSWAYNSVALQPDGKIVAVGITDGNNGLIARFNPDGSLDKVFDTINIAAEYISVAIDDDGKIIAVGGAISGDDLETDSLIARFLPNGVLDAESNWNLQSFRESAKNNNIPIALLG